MDEKTSNSLVSLVDQMAEIEQALIQSGGEIDESMDELIPIINGQVAEKIDNYAYLIDRLKYNAKFYSAKAEGFLKMAAACEKFSDKLLDNMTWSMHKHNLPELFGNDFKYKLMRSESVTVLNENQVPSEFQNIKTVATIDKKRVKEALKAGRDIPGVALSINTRAQKFTNSPGKK